MLQPALIAPFFNLILELDKNLILTGQFSDTGAQYDALLVKITNNLDTLWTRKYDASVFDRFWNTAVADDSGYVSVGEVRRSSSSTKMSIFILKTDKNGKELWRKKYDYGSSSRAVNVTITKKGKILISGIASNNSFLMKLDSIGRRIWYKTYPYEGAFDIHEMPKCSGLEMCSF